MAILRRNHRQRGNGAGQVRSRYCRAIRESRGRWRAPDPDLAPNTGRARANYERNSAPDRAESVARSRTGLAAVNRPPQPLRRPDLIRPGGVTASAAGGPRSGVDIARNVAHGQWNRRRAQEHWLALR